MVASASCMALSPVAAFAVGGVGCGCLGGAGVSMGATFLGRDFCLTSMSVGRGGGAASALGGGTGAALACSGARTDLSTGLYFWGRGIAETIEAWMAPTDAVLSPKRLLLWLMMRVVAMKAAASRTCSPTAT